LEVRSYSFESFNNGFARQATKQTDKKQLFKDQKDKFPEMYGIEDYEIFAEIKCLATLEVDPND
jgi:hypothetical protein